MDGISALSPLGTFRDWHKQVHLNPIFGYFGSGRSKIGSDEDFSTRHTQHSEFYGQLWALQALRLFEGMKPEDEFVIFEVGAGTGQLADSLLSFVKNQKGPRWRKLWEKLRYVCLEASPQFAKKQRWRLKRFGDRVEVLEGDILKLQPKRVRDGMLIANELLDDLPHDWLRVQADGKVEMPVPLHTVKVCRALEALLEKGDLERLQANDGAIRKALDRPKPDQKSLLLTLADWILLKQRAVEGGLEEKFDAHVCQLEWVARPLAKHLTPILKRHRKAIDAVLEKMPKGAKHPVSFLAPWGRHYFKPSVSMGGLHLFDVGQSCETFLAKAKEIVRGRIFFDDYGASSFDLLCRGTEHGSDNFTPPVRVLRTYPKRKTFSDFPGKTNVTCEVNFTTVGQVAVSQGFKVAYEGPEANLFQLGPGMNWHEKMDEFNAIRLLYNVPSFHVMALDTPQLNVAVSFGAPPLTERGAVEVRSHIALQLMRHAMGESAEKFEKRLQESRVLMLTEGSGGITPCRPAMDQTRLSLIKLYASFYRQLLSEEEVRAPMDMLPLVADHARAFLEQIKE